MTVACGAGRSPRRIHVVGGPGSGKTSLATRLAAELDLPLIHLDEIARVGGGTGPARSMEERLQDVKGLATSPAWVTEGVHLGWTDELLERAEVIVWLDHVGSSVASRRIVTRFLRNAVAEMRRRRGRERFLRLGDYARQLRDLLTGVRETRGYYPSGGSRMDGPTRSETQARLDRLAGPGQELIHCRSAQDVDRLMARFAPPAGPIDSPSAPPGRDPAVR